MKLRELQGNNPGKIYELAGDEFTIGRELDNSIVINEASVSRHHCKLYSLDDVWMVEDLHSVNGVSVNGSKVDGGCQLYDKDVIKVFNHEFLFFEKEEKPAAPVQEKIIIKLEDTPPETLENREEAEGGKLGFVVKIAALLLLLALCTFLGIKLLSGKNSGEKQIVINNDSLPEQPKTEIAVDNNSPSLLSQEELDKLNVEPEDNTQQKPQMAKQADDFVEPTADGEKLVDYFLVESVPPGAKVLLDKRLRGTTPVILKKLPAGEHTLELVLNGYDTFTRQIHVPDTLPDKPFKLNLLPGVVSVITEPAGAWVLEGRRFWGVTPLLITGMSEGKHELTIQGPACEAHKETLEITGDKGVNLSLMLKSILGSLNLATRPGNCKVLLNGNCMGITTANKENPAVADPLTISGLLPGQYLLTLEHPSGISRSGTFTISKGQNITQNVHIWLPTHKITLVDGKEFSAMLLQQNQHGDMVMEFINGQVQRFLKPQISKVYQYKNDEIEEVLEKLLKSSGKNPNQGAFNRRDDHVMTAAQLQQNLDSMSAQGFNTAYQNKQILLSGISIARMKEKGLISLLMSNNVKCLFAPGTPDEVFQEVSKAGEKGKSITIRGICEGTNNTKSQTVLVNCTLEASVQ